MSDQVINEHSVITSAPALAAALRETDHIEAATWIGDLFPADALVPMYQVNNGSIDEEAAAAAHVVSETAERLRRLADAYAEWSTFDASAYFDLSERQAAQLVRVHERISTVYVTFQADLLLPSFRKAESFWVGRFCPIYHAAYLCSAQHPGLRGEEEPDAEIQFLSEIQPEMIARWRHLLQVLQHARTTLMNDIGFLSANGSQDERARWQYAWEQRPARCLAAALRPALSQVPTLSLAYEFPLPAYRQSGRRRRLQQHRERQRRNRRRGRS
jgi:hypothetical protein